MNLKIGAALRAAVLGIAAWGVPMSASAQASTYEGTADDFMQISQLFAQYSYGLNMSDVAARADTFTVDGVFQTPQNCNLNMGRGAVKGHKPVPRQEMPAPGAEETRKMFPIASLGPIVYLDKDNATVHSIVMLLIDSGKGVHLDRAGIYDDKLKRVNGKWKIAYRFAQMRLPPGTKYVPCPAQEGTGFKFYMYPEK